VLRHPAGDWVVSFGWRRRHAFRGERVLAGDGYGVAPRGSTAPRCSGSNIAKTLGYHNCQPYALNFLREII
jgi:hypothetical protein